MTTPASGRNSPILDKDPLSKGYSNSDLAQLAAANGKGPSNYADGLADQFSNVSVRSSSLALVHTDRMCL